MRNASFFFFALLFLLLTPDALRAQENFILADGSTIRVDGASNRSDWSVEATSFSGSFNVVDGVPESGSLIVPVADMKSGRSLIMDRLMHSTFEAETNPDITFALESVEPAEEEGWWLMNGQLQMAGTTHPVSVRLQQQGQAGRTLRYTGSHELKMTDFNMKPPTAMFGSLHTRDEVTIQFELLLASTCEEECPSDGDSGR